MSKKLYKKLNFVKSIPLFVIRIVVYPFKLITMPLIMLIGFFVTDWEYKPSRDFFKEVFDSLIKL